MHDPGSYPEANPQQDTPLDYHTGQSSICPNEAMTYAWANIANESTFASSAFDTSTRHDLALRHDIQTSFTSESYFLLSLSWVSTNRAWENQAVLTKIDKLRELNVGSIIPLPQLVVVGDQSSGKSSVLESLTGFAFPPATGLCTRYATQITCRREAREGVSVSIIPRPQADEVLKTELRKFRRNLSSLDNDDLATIFQEANEAMGIRMDTADNVASLGAFSEDMLKIEISGPDQTHLTVIDVPGIFRVPMPGLTTESDVVLVQNMVKTYMHNRRTMSVAADPFAKPIELTRWRRPREILRLAETADPDGVRTMGVLTKPDLATEKATKDAIVNLVLGKRNPLKLGYCVVKNRSADDESSTIFDRLSAEKAFFMCRPWLTIADRCGVTSLQGRLRELLMDISKREFPHVKLEIEKRLRDFRAKLLCLIPQISHGPLSCFVAWFLAFQASIIGIRTLATISADISFHSSSSVRVNLLLKSALLIHRGGEQATEHQWLIDVALIHIGLENRTDGMKLALVRLSIKGFGGARLGNDCRIVANVDVVGF
ncbi:P-loop containing nucleoside triphosphate hydrolase protein [Xylariaceae sp. AK1471]|nr:P-loop containing nucleoside triphosphate hydrolase protein [Xylariaceae sp. AK1471]